MKTTIIMIALMATVACVNGGFLQQIPNWIQKCTDKGLWSDEIEKRIATFKNFKAKDVACALKCVGVQSGVISSSGKINVDELIEGLIERNKFDSNAAETLRQFGEHCVQAAESDKGECAPAGALSQCLSRLFAKHRKH